VTKSAISLSRFAAIAALLGSAGIAHALPSQLRTYVDIDWRVHGDGTGAITIKPFLREETHFQAQGPRYGKWTAGVRGNLAQWLSYQAYYGCTHMMEEIPTAKRKRLAVGQTIVHTKVGRFYVRNGETAEMHATDDFLRYRNITEIAIRTPVRRSTAYVSEEFRIDLDQGRVNQNDVAVGVQVGVNRVLVVRWFVDIESSRRHSGNWRETFYTGISISAHG